MVDRKKGKKGEKKRFNLLPPGKGEIGGLTFFSFFFNRGIKRQYPKDLRAVQNLHRTFWQRSEKKQKKRVSCNHRPDSDSEKLNAPPQLRKWPKHYRMTSLSWQLLVITWPRIKLQISPLSPTGRQGPTPNAVACRCSSPPFATAQASLRRTS